MVYAKKVSGELPSHHMFGAFELERDHQMELIIPPLVKYAWINRIGKLFDIDFFEQQLRCLFILNKCDVIYAPYAATNTKLLVLLKLFGLINKPLIILVYMPLFGEVSRNRWKRMFVKRLIMQYDRLIFFNERMRNEIAAGYGFDEAYCKRHFSNAQWGVDMEYFSRIKVPCADADPVVFSSGNTCRDFDILIRVARRMDVPFRIYCKPESFPTIKEIPSNVTLLSGEFPFEDICVDQARATVVLIPVVSGAPGMIGYTSLLDALALGRPVIMTQNLYIDVDFEKEAIGFTVPAGDEEGWYCAIKRIFDERDQAAEMARKSARLGKERFDIVQLARKLAETIHSLNV